MDGREAAAPVRLLQMEANRVSAEELIARARVALAKGTPDSDDHAKRILQKAQRLFETAEAKSCSTTSVRMARAARRHKPFRVY